MFVGESVIVALKGVRQRHYSMIEKFANSFSSRGFHLAGKHLIS